MSIQTSYSEVYGRTATYFSFDYTPNQDTIPTKSSLYQQNNTEATTDLFLSSTQESTIPSFSSLYQQNNGQQNTVATTDLFLSSTQESMIPSFSSLYQQNNDQQNTVATTDLFLSSTQESMIPSFSSLYQETNHTMNTTELFSSSTQETSIPTLSSLVQETNHTVPTSNIFSTYNILTSFSPLNTSANAEVFKGEKEVLLEATYSNTTKRRAKKDVSSIDALDITDNKFHSNPCLLQHRCLPAERCRDKASRVTYKSTQALRIDKEAHKAPTYRHYSKAAEAILEMDWKNVERRQVLQAFAGKDYASKRTTFARAAAAQKRKILMSDVPEDLREVAGGEEFLRLQKEDLHVYFSEELVRLACSNRLVALIGDGVHKLNPLSTPNRMDKGQLYILHAVTTGGLEIPILYAVSRFKTLETYRTIFAKLNGALTTRNIRIILDYEKAAIRAAREVFPEASIEGCAFHLAQAWNRKSADLGLRRFVRGPKKISVVTNWWKILKGIVFLPKHLISRVPALTSPPVNPGHVAHEACSNFLNYLRSVWFTGVYASMWCKWGHEELRTTNIAEAFHSKLRTILSRRINPPFEELLECIREQHTLALAKMLYAGENNTATKSLRSRDRLRREKINTAMAEFKEVVDNSNDVGVEDIIVYCRNMSRYVSEKLV